MMETLQSFNCNLPEMTQQELNFALSPQDSPAVVSPSGQLSPLQQVPDTDTMHHHHNHYHHHDGHHQSEQHVVAPFLHAGYTSHYDDTSVVMEAALAVEMNMGMQQMQKHVGSDPLMAPTFGSLSPTLGDWLAQSPGSPSLADTTRDVNVVADECDGTGICGGGMDETMSEGEVEEEEEEVMSAPNVVVVGDVGGGSSEWRRPSLNSDLLASIRDFRSDNSTAFTAATTTTSSTTTRSSSSFAGAGVSGAEALHVPDTFDELTDEQLASISFKDLTRLMTEAGLTNEQITEAKAKRRRLKNRLSARECSNKKREKCTELSSTNKKLMAQLSALEVREVQLVEENQALSGLNHQLTKANTEASQEVLRLQHHVQHLTQLLAQAGLLNEDNGAAFAA